MRRAGDLWNAPRFLPAPGAPVEPCQSAVSFLLQEGAPVLGEGQPERGLSLLSNLGSQLVAS